MARLGAVGTLLATAALAVGCGAGGDSVIDTWPVAAPLQCGDAAYCQAEVAVGLAGIDSRDPGHAPAVSTELHLLGSCADPKTGERILFTYGGFSPDVLVAHLADGSTHAIGVGGHGIDRGPFATDWSPSMSSCGAPPSR